MPLEMNPEIRARWTAALRSGDYQQARSALYDGAGYCCLGVLCELARQDGVVTLGYIDYEGEDGEWQYADSPAYLPLAVKTWAGLHDGNPLVRANGVNGYPALATLNDEYGWSFAKIADAIDGGAS